MKPARSRSKEKARRGSPSKNRLDRARSPRRKRSRSPTHSKRRHANRSRSRSVDRYHRRRSSKERRKLKEKHRLREGQEKRRPVAMVALDVPMENEEAALQQMLGFTNFSSTKGEKVRNNEAGASMVHKKRKYRQYMNRRGGFNRPLESIS